MREVPFVPKADDLALATSHLAQSSSASRVTAAQAGFFILPVGRAAGMVGGILALRDDAFKTPTRRFDARVGALIAIRALPDLCLGIVSERLGNWTFSLIGT